MLQDEREKDYERIPVSRSYNDVRSQSRSGDRDFRAERYLGMILSISFFSYKTNFYKFIFVLSCNLNFSL